MLKSVLKQTICQWELMVMNPDITKPEAYIILGGKSSSYNFCFLCDYMECKDCISWKILGDLSQKDGFQCEKEGSPYRKWQDAKGGLTGGHGTKKAETKAVLDYLIYEMGRLSR